MAGNNSCSVTRRCSLPAQPVQPKEPLVLGSWEYADALEKRKEEIRKMTSCPAEQRVLLRLWKSKNDINNTVKSINSTLKSQQGVIKSFFEHTCPEKFRHHIRSTFSAWDSDGNGALDQEEILHALHEAGQHPSEEEMEEIFELFDQDKNGTFSLDEFESMVRVLLGQKTMDMARVEMEQKQSEEPAATILPDAASSLEKEGVKMVDTEKARSHASKAASTILRVTSTEQAEELSLDIGG